MMEYAKKQAVQPIKPDSAAQIKCSLIQNQKESIVVLNISHLCADGSDGKYLLQKLTEAYQLFRQNGTCNGLIVKNGRRDAEQVYELLSRKEVWSLIKNPTTGIHSSFPYPQPAKVLLMPFSALFQLIKCKRHVKKQKRSMQQPMIFSLPEFTVLTQLFRPWSVQPPSALCQ